MGKYDDIINLTRPESKYPRMSIEQRSAQFAPFAALVGFDEKIDESARFVDSRIELNDEEKYLLDIKMQMICKKLNEYPDVSFTYFVNDIKKEGGKYITKIGKITKIDKIRGIIILDDEFVINIKDIIEINELSES